MADSDGPRKDTLFRQTVALLRERIGLDRARQFAAYYSAARLAYAGPSRLSEATKRAYMRRYNRMRLSGTTPTDSTGCSRTFYFSRAAWIYGVVADLDRLFDAISRAPEAYAEALAAAAVRLEQLASDLLRFPPDPERKNVEEARNGERVGDFAQLCEGRPPGGRPSKRVNLHVLPEDWVELLIAEAAAARSRFTTAIAAMAATGARPIEFEAGVELTLAEQGNAVQVRILGAKFKPGQQGQQTRTLICHRGTPGVDQMLTELRAAGGKPITVTANRGSLLDAIRSFGKRVYDADDYTISSYSLRHQCAADIKADETMRDQGPAALGHATDRTIQSYGDQRYARGTRRLTATASGPVKRTARDPRVCGLGKTNPAPAAQPGRRRRR